MTESKNNDIQYQMMLQKTFTRREVLILAVCSGLAVACEDDQPGVVTPRQEFIVEGGVASIQIGRQEYEVEPVTALLFSEHFPRGTYGMGVIRSTRTDEAEPLQACMDAGYDPNGYCITWGAVIDTNTFDVDGSLYFRDNGDWIGMHIRPNNRDIIMKIE